jgi:outer membrane protein OmpA-like peptidoglycan-associated protein
MRNLEGNAAARYFPIEKLAITLGGGSSISDAVGAPDWRIFASVAYRHPAEEKEQVVEEVLRTNKVHFEFDKARILAKSYPVLDEIIQTLKHPKVQSVRIEGHTDSKGSDEYNQRLSERRANSIKQYLVRKGVPSSKLSTEGKGESVPIAKNEIDGKDNPEGRALNRRVEFHLTFSSRKNLRVVERDTAPTFVE